MPWYAWIMLVFLILTICAFVIYILVVNRRLAPEEVRKELEKSKKAEKEAKEKLIEEKLARKKAEKERAAKELAYLELVHKKDLERLGEKEKVEYEKAKEDPQTGVDFMRDFLGDGSDPG